MKIELVSSFLAVTFVFFFRFLVNVQRDLAQFLVHTDANENGDNVN